MVDVETGITGMDEEVAKTIKACRETRFFWPSIKWIMLRGLKMQLSFMDLVLGEYYTVFEYQW